MKKSTVLMALAVALGMLLPAYGIMGDYISKTPERVISDIITPLPSHATSLPHATQTHKMSIGVTRNQLPLDIPVATSEIEELEPALAVSRTGSLFGAYTSKTSLFEQDIAFAYSSSGGTAWESMGSYTIEGIQNYPTLDYWRDDNSFVGTFAPDPSDFEGSAQYLLRVTDPTDTGTWDLVYWDWTSFQQRDRESPDIAGYDDVGDVTWWWGVIAATEGSDDPEAAGEHVPVFNFPDYTTADSGWGWWWSEYENAAHACVDIDRSNGMMYAAWDQFNSSTPEKGRDILLAIADVHDWWEENWVVNWFYIGGAEDNTYPDVAVKNGYVYIVAQADILIPGKQDVVCYYSHDGGTTWDVSTVAGNPADDELYPQIVAYGEGASCIYTVNGNLYAIHTEDGGVTWGEPIQINDQQGSVYMNYRTAHIASSGHLFWTDTRSGNTDIYYDKAVPPVPILSVESITGGFGAKATIANIGTADAETVQWSIVFDGPVFVGKEKSGTTTILAGETTTIKSGFIFGIGRVTIQVTANDATKTATAFVLGPLVLGVE